jgi:molybdopterin molybdotransferase
LLAANGYAAINVMRRPRIGIFSTGDELAESGCKLSSAQLFDANRPLLLGLAIATGAQVEDLGIVRDDLVATVHFFRQHLGRYDMLISSGAVSVGGKDFVKQAFESNGGKVDFWKVAMKPGKPVVFGHFDGTVFAGLPGNSFAVFVSFKLFLEGMVARLQGQSPVPFANASGIADFDWTRSTGRTEYFPVSICDGGGQGMCRLRRLGHGGSASLYPVSMADGVAVVSAELETIKPGDELLLHRFV